ncbi:hypothetical protein HELRODRAFT_127695, partial [Helobdella robusta]|uniref:Homeobox domain-containing protein n=2 Tax=Annelida TaxID=6340 RepID=T1EHG7_HELRO
KRSTKEIYREVYTVHQKKVLEKEFNQKKFIEKKDRDRISNEIGLDDRQIKYWFQNRRVKARKQGK